MNEAAIVASLQAKMKPLDTPAPLVAEVVKEAAQPLETAKLKESPNDVAALKLVDFFEFERVDMQDREKMDMLNKIYSWVADQVKSDDSVDIMLHLRQLEGRLGLTFRKGNKLGAIYRYLKLDSERRRIEKEMNLG
jgi:hypothetical protein